MAIVVSPRCFALKYFCSLGGVKVDPVVYACDIGSVKSGSFAWARNENIADPPSASNDIDALIASISSDAANGVPVSLGFEAPLFLPVPESSTQLNSGRRGEGNRSMFAQAGTSVTTIAVHQSAWILRQLRLTLPTQTSLTFDWTSDWRRPHKLFIWEAFVSSSAHSEQHESDAATAVQYFLANEHDLDSVNAVQCDNPLSLIAASCLWSNWLTDLQALHTACLVLRPSEPYSGHIERHTLNA